MKIAGLQELTLIDYTGKLACTIFLYGCNFRCGFCHNPELVVEPLQEEYSEEKILNFLEARKRYLDGICITGGEPSLSLNEDFLIQIKKLGYAIKIDTNGSFPKKLKDLIEKKLVDYIAMDIKSDKINYDFVCRVSVNIKDIEESIKIISNFKDYEFRTTVIPGYHNVEVVKKIGEWLNSIVGKKPKKYVIQNFVARDKLIDKSFEKVYSFSEQELEEMKKSVEEFFEEVEVRS